MRKMRLNEGVGNVRIVMAGAEAIVKKNTLINFQNMVDTSISQNISLHLFSDTWPL